MAARVILPEEIEAQPDLTPTTGEFNSISFQDCMTIVSAYERMCHSSATEESIFAPISHVIQGTKYWAKSNSELFSSRLQGSNIVQSDSDNKIKIRSESPATENTFQSILQSQSFEEALQTIKDDCIPCDERIKLSLENLPTQATLDLYFADIKARIGMLSDLDKLLGDIEVFKDICPLLEVLNFMCIPDLQRLISILMASIMKVNVSLLDLFGLIIALIMPLVMPMLSGLVHMLDQFSVLVISPVDCMLDVMLEQLNKLNVGGITQQQIDELKELKNSNTLEGGVLVGVGLQELYKATIDGRNYASSKLNFYTTALEKAITDVTGNNQNYMKLASQKLRVVQLIKFIISIIELQRKGGTLCQPGQTPSERELDTFFRDFLNPNSFVQVSVDPDGNIRLEEPEEVLYQIEEPSKGAKILIYEPDDLLQKPVAMAFKCSFHTSPSDIEKINTWIKELNTVTE